MLIYEMITLKQPYYHLPIFQVANSIQQGALPLFPEDIPSTYDRLISLIKTKMLLPAEERSTADELVNEFVKLM